MAPDIKAVFLDVGNTLRIVIKDPTFQEQAKNEITQLVGAQMPVDEFIELLEDRYSVLRKRAKEQWIEASETEMWTQWMLPDFPEEKIAPLSGRLTTLWRSRDGRREARLEVKEVVLELYKRGYVLGIIANTITESEIPDWLVEDDLTEYFTAVVLSSKIGFRKPGPEIYLEAARLVGFEPKYCVYVGDNPMRDIQGARDAGYGMTIILKEPATLKKEPSSGEHKPDKAIDNLLELLDIFPPIK